MSDPSLQSIPRFDQFEIMTIGTTSIDATSAVAGNYITSTITHGLGYIPVAFIYISGITYRQIPIGGLPSNDGTHVSWGYWASYELSSTQLFIYIYPGFTGSIGNFDFKYYLCRSKASQ